VRAPRVATPQPDPARIGDSLFVRDDATRTYVPLTPALAAQIRGSKSRL